jgi:hypothetical protein
MAVKQVAGVMVIGMLLVACGGESIVDTDPGSTTTGATITIPHTDGLSPGSITDLETLAGTWYLSGPTNSAMHFTADGDWWWAKNRNALDLKMDREPDGRITFEEGKLVFVEDDVCNGEEHGYEVTLSETGVDFIGDDACTRRLLWLSPPSGDTTWSLVEDE